jgi:hypothetical protein
MCSPANKVSKCAQLRMSRRGDTQLSRVLSVPDLASIIATGAVSVPGLSKGDKSCVRKRDWFGDCASQVE